MEKIICDMCGKDITEDNIFDLEIYDSDAEKNIYEKELCKVCANQIIKILKAQEKKNKETKENSKGWGRPYGY